MEKSSDHTSVFKQEPKKKQKGGMRTMPFIIANEAFEKVASYGLLSNMILYLIQDYRMGVTQGQNILFLWSAATNFLPIVGAVVADSYLGRYLTIALGSIFSFMGITILWLTAMIPQARPGPCDPRTEACKTTSTAQYFVLLSSFVLMSIGAGGVRPCSLAFGADQIDNKNNPMNKKMLERFFGWYYASAAVAIVLAFTGIVYIQDHLGWKVGFGIPALMMFLSAALFFIASSFYIKSKVKTNLFGSLLQVIRVVYKKRKLTLPSIDSNIAWYTLKDSERQVPTDRLRCMNKACIIMNPEDIGPDGVASDPRNICTVDQVEELKTLIRVLPLWSTAIMMAINMSQGTFGLLQAKSMDRHLIGGFEIPAGTFGMFTIGTIFIWILLYDRVLLPLASKIRGKRVHIGVKARMGMGLFCSFMAMVVSAIVEHKRRTKAIEQGLRDNPSAVLDMSAYWLVPQHVLNGLAEAFNSIAQTEFYYSEFPKSMSSIASAMFGLGMAFASLLASAILSTVDDVTSKGGKESWTSSNINRGHYESYYWLLAIMSAANLVYYLVCSWAYGPCVEQRNGFMGYHVEGSGSSEEELVPVNKSPPKGDKAENNNDESSDSRSTMPDLLKLPNRGAHESENGGDRIL